MKMSRKKVNSLRLTTHSPPRAEQSYAYMSLGIETFLRGTTKQAATASDSSDMPKN